MAGRARSCWWVGVLGLLLALGGCVSPQSWEAARLLQDIEAGGGPSTLKEMTPAPVRRGIRYERDGRVGIADLYEPGQKVGAGLVLVPGFTPWGKDDPRVVELAMSFARARFRVLVPDLIGARRMRVRLEDAEAIADAMAELARHDMPVLGAMAISYAAGLAVLASERADARAALGFLVALGGYYDTEAVTTFVTAGFFRAGPAAPWQRGAPHPAAKWLFLASNLDLLADIGDRAVMLAIADRRVDDPATPVDDWLAQLGPEGRALFALLDNRRPELVPELIAALPERMRAQLRQLSLRGRDLSHLAGRLILVHGRADGMIPYTESMALAGAVPGTELFLIDGFSHIEPRGVGLAGRWQLLNAVQAVLKRRMEN